MTCAAIRLLPTPPSPTRMTAARPPLMHSRTFDVSGSRPTNGRLARSVAKAHLTSHSNSGREYPTPGPAHRILAVTTVFLGLPAERFATGQIVIGTKNCGLNG